MLKGTGNFKRKELDVILDSDEVSAQRKYHIEFKVNPKSKYLLSSDEQDPTLIKEEDNEDDDYNSLQLVNVETSLNHLEDDEPSCSSDDNTQHHVNVGCFEFVDTNKFTEKELNLTSKHSRHKDQPKIHESEKKKIKCPECHKTFAGPSQLERHTRVHTGEKPFKCTACEKTFTQLSNLNRHTLTHTSEKPHECDVCHKSFIQKNNLITHKRIHSNERPYQCAVCNKGCVTSSDLTVHMRIHTGEKPYHCHLCEYKCTSTGALKIHIRSHTGEKPYSCKLCEKLFTTTSELRKHERRLHSDVDSK